LFPSQLLVRVLSWPTRERLAVPYAERQEAKALGARWDAVKKAWFVEPEADREKIAKWEPKHQPAPTLVPRAEFAAVLREIGAIVEGEHPIMNGEAQRIPAVNDKRGELTIFYVAHDDGVPNGYAENNRTKEVVRWKATGQRLSREAKASLAAQAKQKRYARKQAEQEMHEATAKRLIEELRLNNSGVSQTAYHKAKQIEGISPTNHIWSAARFQEVAQAPVIRRVFFSDLKREPLQYLIRRHFGFHL
jgi:putative DNA primase/helicase